MCVAEDDFERLQGKSHFFAVVALSFVLLSSLPTLKLISHSSLFLSLSLLSTTFISFAIMFSRPMMAGSDTNRNIKRSTTAAGLGEAGSSPSSFAIGTLPTRQRTAKEEASLLQSPVARRLSMAHSSAELGRGNDIWADEIKTRLSNKRMALANLERDHAALTVNYQKKQVGGMCNILILHRVVPCLFVV
jgi:hypothetical protein